MTIDQLYCYCENLDHNTWFEIRKSAVFGKEQPTEDEGNYTFLYAKWAQVKIKGFKVNDYGGYCIIYI